MNDSIELLSGVSGRPGLGPFLPKERTHMV